MDRRLGRDRRRVARPRAGRRRVEEAASRRSRASRGSVPRHRPGGRAVSQVGQPRRTSVDRQARNTVRTTLGLTTRVDASCHARERAAVRKPDTRPVRSLLYTPGDQERRIAENVKSGADALFLDIEEPRTPCPEATRVRPWARPRIPRHAPVGAGAPLYFVRVQPVASGMILRDLQAVMGPNLTGVLLPKITGPADVHAADAILPCLEVELGLPVGRRCCIRSSRTRGDPQRVRDRDGIGARRVHGRRGVALRRHRCRHRLSLDAYRHRDAVHPREGAHRRARGRDPLPDQRHVGRRQRRPRRPARVADRAPRHRLLRHDDRELRARAHRQRGVHAHPKRSRTGRSSTGSRARPRRRATGSSTATRTRARATRSTSRTSRPPASCWGGHESWGSRES